MITNNFKISNNNHDVIYTYKVDFLEAAPTEMSGSRGGGDRNESMNEEESKTKFTYTEGTSLETFQKFKIMNDSAP